MDVASFISSYPPIDERWFQFEIARRKEFLELKLPKAEAQPDIVGTPLLHQELQKRFFSPFTDYDRCLFYHETGTGKSCLASFIIENFKAKLRGDGVFRKALVLVPSGRLADNTRQEIAYKCTSGDYIPRLTEEEIQKAETMTKRKEKGRLKKLVAETYEIQTFYKFFKGLSSSKKEVQKKYNNRIIVIDEAHQLRIQPKKAQKEGLRIYKKAHEFLHTVKDCRIFLLTATPIWDRAFELAALFNLILDEEEQLPTGNEFMKTYFDEDRRLKEEGIEDLKRRFSAKVSYLRQMSSTARKIWMGVIKPWFQKIEVYPSVMSDFQAEYAREALEFTGEESLPEEEIEIAEQKIGGERFRISARDAAVFTFPVLDSEGNVVGGTYGSEAFEKNIGGDYKYKNKNVKKAIRSNLAKYSSVFASILKSLEEHPNEVAFIFGEYKAAGGGGVINLGMVLRLFGYKWVRSPEELTLTEEHNHFVVLTPELVKSSGSLEKISEKIAARDNRFGARCRVIIVSPAFGVGLTFKNVRQFHNLSGHWNLSMGDQAFGRVFRFGSHDAFNEEEKYVRIYQHVAVNKGDEYQGHDLSKGFPEDIGFSGEIDTIGLQIYKVAEEKDMENMQAYRILKEVSWDCPLAYKRNVISGDNDGSRECNYMDCNYVCDGFPDGLISKRSSVWRYKIPPGGVDYDTYNLHYSSTQLGRLKRAIQNLFRIHFRLDFDSLARNLGRNDTDQDRFLVLKACSKMIDERTPIHNRYGFMDTLKEEGNVYFLSKTISPFSSYSDSFYSEVPMITESLDLKYVAQIVSLKTDKSKVKKFCQNPEAKQGVLDSMNYRTKILLLEEGEKIGWKLYVKGEDLNEREEEAMRIIDNKLGHNIREIEGKRIHNMLAEEDTGEGYSKAAKPTGLMRYLDPETGIWKYVGIKNENKYIGAFKTAPREALEGKLRGVIDAKGNFKIVDPERGGKGAQCKTIVPKSRIVDYIKQLGILPPSPKESIGESKEVLIDRIMSTGGVKSDPLASFKNREELEEYDLESLEKILSLSEFSTIQLCNLLRNYFESQGLLEDLSI